MWLQNKFEVASPFSLSHAKREYSLGYGRTLLSTTAICECLATVFFELYAFITFLLYGIGNERVATNSY